MKRSLLLIAFFIIPCATGLRAQVITTIAGGDNTDYYTDFIPAVNAKLDNPWAVAVDDSSDVYFSEPNLQVVRKIDRNGIITTVAGTYVAGYSGDNGPATDAKLDFPYGLATDHAGNLYIADHDNNMVRKVSPSGIITRFAGTGIGDYSGDAGMATDADLAYPFDVATDIHGNVYIADAFNMAIRKVNASGVIFNVINGFNGTLAHGGEGYTGDLWLPSNTRLSGIALDSIDNLYIADYWDNVIRRVTPAGSMTIICGNSTSIPNDGGDGGPAAEALTWGPKRITVNDSGNIVFSVHDDNRIRSINHDGIISTIVGATGGGFAGDGGLAVNAKIIAPIGLCYDHAGNMYFADNNNSRIRRVSTWQSNGVKQLAAPGTLELLPNPNTGAFSINGQCAQGDEQVSITVIDMTGKTLQQQNSQALNGNICTQISATDLPNGMYLLKITSASGVAMQKFIVEK